MPRVMPPGRTALRVLPVLFAVALLAILLGREGEAFAQSITVSPTVYRLNAQGQTFDRGLAAPNTYGINYADCVEDVSFRFNVTATGPGSAFYAFISQKGVNCGDSANRATQTAKCWPVMADAIPFKNLQDLTFRVRDLLSQASPNINPKVQTFTSGTDEVCQGKGFQTGRLELELQFFFLNGDSIAGQKGAITIPVDIKGPPKPTITSIGGGEGRLYIGFTAGSDQDTQGYTLFCNPPPGKEDPGQELLPVGAAAVCPGTAFPNATPIAAGTSQSGDNPDAGTSAATSEGVVLSSEYECGRIEGSTATEAVVTGLKIGYPYWIAMAARDGFKNNGAASDASCGVPVPVTDFWDLYKGAGGQAGGGYCALERVGGRTGAGALGLALAGVASLAVARRRRRR